MNEEQKIYRYKSFFFTTDSRGVEIMYVDFSDTPPIASQIYFQRAELREIIDMLSAIIIENAEV